MCGICSAIGIELRETGEAVVRRMMRAIVQRGPDEEGLLATPGFAAGTRRPSIINISGRNQPVGPSENWAQLRRVAQSEREQLQFPSRPRLRLE